MFVAAAEGGLVELISVLALAAMWIWIIIRTVRPTPDDIDLLAEQARRRAKDHK